MKARITLVIAFAALSLTCSITGTVESVDTAVQLFHRQLDEEQYREIYANAHENYRRAVLEERSRELLKAVHAKLGNIRTVTRSSTWKVSYWFNGQTVTAVYQTTFEKGEGEETFVFRCNSEKALLLRYDIKSPDLIVK